MRLLLDSHALLWWLDDTGLAAPAREAISDAGNEVLISVATVWELAIKAASGKMRLPGDLRERITDESFAELPIDGHDALTAAALPLHDRDPFDRMLIAQAIGKGLTIVTRDPSFGRYGVAVLPA